MWCVVIRSSTWSTPDAHTRCACFCSTKSKHWRGLGAGYASSHWNASIPREAEIQETVFICQELIIPIGTRKTHSLKPPPRSFVRAHSNSGRAKWKWQSQGTVNVSTEQMRFCIKVRTMSSQTMGSQVTCIALQYCRTWKSTYDKEAIEKTSIDSSSARQALRAKMALQINCTN